MYLQGVYQLCLMHHFYLLLSVVWWTVFNSWVKSNLTQNSGRFCNRTPHIVVFWDVKQLLALKINNCKTKAVKGWFFFFLPACKREKRCNSLETVCSIIMLCGDAVSISNTALQSPTLSFVWVSDRRTPHATCHLQYWHLQHEVFL